MPPAPAAYAGTCPTIGKTPDFATFTGSSKDRRFFVVRPADEAPGEILPVLFIWPWLKAGADLTRTAWQLDDATKAFRFVAVVPEPKGDLFDDFPYDVTVSDARIAEEIQYFDDMLACVAAQIPNAALHCVASLGMSAGALFTAQLVARRSEHLASFVSFSGGVGGAVRDLAPLPVHKLPALVAWGGPQDAFYVVNFEQTSTALAGKLVGHAVMECVHDCGHDMPPFDPPLRTMPAYRFALDHPYGLPPGTSPYASALPDGFPSWCAYGVGKVVPRQADGGACPTE
jgi:hypothetical protein